MPCSEKTATIYLGGLPVLRTSRKSFATLMVDDWRRQMAANRRLPAKISFSANGQIIAEVNRDSVLYELHKTHDYIVADGMPVVIASRFITGNPLPERVATTDFFHDAAKAAEDHGLSFYILGSTRENNAAVCENLKATYPRLKIAGAHHGYFNANEESYVVENIQQSKPDILWVGMGFPRQVQFVVRNRESFRGITWVKTCGGLYEHILGTHSRAPLWMQSYSLEWLHRLCCEPKRLLWRYVKTNPLAIWYLLTRSGNLRRNLR